MVSGGPFRRRLVTRAGRRDGRLRRGRCVASPPATGAFPQPAVLTPAPSTWRPGTGASRHSPAQSGIALAVPEPVRISNADKVLYPQSGTTKGEVVEYYRRIAPVLLPHLRGRAVTLRRFPDGVDGESFFEKRCPKHRPPWVHTAEVLLSSGRSYDACTVEDTDTLVWMANLASLELHPSLARADQPERPTVMVFDLDPGAPAAIGQCAEVACALRALFEQLDLQCVAKTSGSKGMQDRKST